jgi:hypothetical protein
MLRIGVWIPLLAAVVVWTGNAQAAPVSIWYRSADGCPTASAFVERLAAHDVDATVARAGDRIDFVVTLGRDERGSSGSLERQSAQGTIAIRQVEAASCEAVADALVLTLALSADPAATAPPAPVTSEPVVAPREPPPETRTPAAVAPPSPADGGPRSAAVSETRAWLPSFGAHGSIGTLTAGAALIGGSAFIDVSAAAGWRPRARLSFVTGFTAPSAALNVELFLGRLEGCPITLGRRLTFEPCVALDLGSLHAQNSETGGTSDAGFWSAAWGLVRGAYEPSPAWAVELEGGVSVPLSHYTLAGGEPRHTLSETQRVTLGLAAGVRVAWP